MPSRAPLISCLCPTRGRIATQPEIIRESLYWFIRLDYPRKELVILNDNPKQEIICNVPGVRVYNADTNFGSLGEKMNALVELAAGDICLPWDDDDISLPHRADQAVQALEGKYVYWTPGLVWYYPRGGNMTADGAGVGHTSGAFKRRTFLGAYPNVTKGHDAEFHAKGVAHRNYNPTKITDPKDISFFYRFNISNWHLSGCTDMNWAFSATPAGPPGKYILEPEMREDFIALHRQCSA